MIWRLALVGWLLLLVASLGHAQFNGCTAGFCGGRASGGAAYSGPIDAAGVSAAECWNASRACSLASAGTAAIDLVRSSDAAVCTGVKTLASGPLDVSGSTAYCNGGTQTVTAYCTAVTCRTNKLYTQTGGHDATKGTVYATNQPVFVVSCPTTSLPCLQPAGAQSLATASFAINQIVWMAAVVNRNPGAAVAQGIMGDAINSLVCDFGNSASTVITYAGTVLSVAASDTNWHSVQCVFNNASSIINADNTTNTGASGSASGVAGGMTLMIDVFGQFHTGYWSEGIVWSMAATPPTGGQQTAVCQNQRLYYLGSTSPC